MRTRALFVTSFAALLGGCFRSDFPTACSENETQCEEVVIDSGTSETSATDAPSTDSLAIDSTTDSEPIDSGVTADSATGDATPVDSSGIDANSDGELLDTPAGDDAEADGSTDDVGPLDAPHDGADAYDADAGSVPDAQNAADADGAADTGIAEVGTDACVGTACSTPPSDMCASTTSRRTFASVGSCNGGTCSYPHTDTPCASAEVCSNGVCVPRSCDGALTCNGESCCASAPVPGGTFKRSYDGVTYADSQYQAAVSGFRLDKYEVTVGRFRRFVDAVVGGWSPAAGTGKHTHLNGGNGLVASAGGYEPGWNAAWSATYLPTDKAVWDTKLACQPSVSTWTPSSGANESRPINCIDWYQAAAFCIWDGGFLPSESEWNYAAAGGSEQRRYPWGATDPAANASLAIYGCYYGGSGCPTAASIAPVGSAAAGNGRWGHSDLAGNVYEWTFDSYATPYVETACIDCAYWGSDSLRVERGGGFLGGAENLLVSRRISAPPGGGGAMGLGARCARLP